MVRITTYYLSRRDVNALHITDAASLQRVVRSLAHGSDDEHFMYADKGGDMCGRSVLILSNHALKTPAHGVLHELPLSKSFWLYEDYRFEVIFNVDSDLYLTALQSSDSEKLLSNWFCTQALQWGVSIQAHTLCLANVEPQCFQLDTGALAHIHPLPVKGLLHVNDAQLFKQSVCNGVGTALEFGCGLLQVQPYTRCAP